MPLESQIADEVEFTCESCGREQGLRSLRRRGGTCVTCGAASWRLMTKYHEGPNGHSILTLFLALVFDIHIARRYERTVEFVTSHVPGADAADIARLGWEYKRGAFRYMEMRREMDAATERQRQIKNGARNCLSCGFFFMPTAERPWTTAGYCSKGCFGNPDAETALSLLSASPDVPSASKPHSRILTVVCQNGHVFEVAAMYAGTFRPCPVCQRKTNVSQGE